MACQAQDFHPPAGERFAVRGAREAILPGGRVLMPFGQQVETGPGPFGLAVSRNGTVATADIGYERFGVTVISPAGKEHHIWASTPGSKTPEAASPDWKGVFFGIVFDTPHSVWVAEGESGKVRQLDTTTGAARRIVSLDGGEMRHSFSSDLAYDATRRLLYVVDQANFRVVVIDTKKGRVVSSVEVGRMPFGIALSPDGKAAWVTNTGVFRYQPLAGRPIPFPAFGFPSRESAEGTGDVPALGDPNVRESNSVSVIDLADATRPSVRQWIRTGKPFGPGVAGGSAPSGVLAAGDKVFVSNAHDDTISVIDARKGTVLAEIALSIGGLERFRGVMPAGMAYDPVTNWLLVAEAGINAVGVIDTRTNKVLGHIPVGWLPTRVAISGDRVFVANARGQGTGPNLRRPLRELGEVPNLHRGTVSTFVVPRESELAQHTARVLFSNGFVPGKREAPAMPSAVRHVVLIVKENRTFDEVFGELPLARFGLHGNTSGGGTQFAVQDAAVTPNHHGLARRWAISDNFYADADVSVDGHHWLAGATPDLLTESGLLAAYGGQRKFVLDANAPGRLLFPGSSSSVHPEEQPEAGTLWHHLERNGVSFRNFGEGFELAGVVEGKDEEPTGARFVTNIPMPEPLFRNTSREYPGFNMNIPDQYRANQLMAELDRRYGKGGEALPQFIYIHLPNDHMAPPRPQDGYPYEASYVEDNDLALGRILEYLSHSPWWKEMAVFVTEDDAQGGLDHIDSHRTVLMAVGPYVKRGYVSHVNSSFPGLLRTIFELLRMPPLNLMDATAASLRDLFTETPDFTPYQAEIPDLRIFDATKVRVGTGPTPAMDSR